MPAPDDQSRKADDDATVVASGSGSTPPPPETLTPETAGGVLRSSSSSTWTIYDQLGPGSTFANYLIERKLGEGGMGMVYSAREQPIDRIIALKVMRPELANDPGFKDRFLREAKTAGSVLHPNVVTLFTAGEQDGCLYMTFEFVPGGDLSDRLREHGPLPVPEALRIIRACADGLEAIAEAGLVHRDIKPQNILLDKNGRAKLGDLGLARKSNADDRLTATGVGMGTPAYMSPEQALGEPDIDIRSDIHALGGTLYTLLTNKMPFEGASPFAISNMVINGPRPDPSTIFPAIDARVGQLVRRMMDVDRDKRFVNASALITAIDQLIAQLASGQVPAPAPSAAPAAPSPTPPTIEPPAAAIPAAKSGGGLRVLVSIILLAALGAGGYAGWRAWDQAQQQPTPTPPAPVETAPDPSPDPATLAEISAHRVALAALDQQVDLTTADAAAVDEHLAALATLGDADAESTFATLRVRAAAVADEVAQLERGFAQIELDRLSMLDQAQRQQLRADRARLVTLTGDDNADARAVMFALDSLEREEDAARTQADRIAAMRSELSILDRSVAPPADSRERLAAFAALAGENDPDLARWRARLDRIDELEALLAALDDVAPLPEQAELNLTELAGKVGATESVRRWRSKLSRVNQLLAKWSVLPDDDSAYAQRLAVHQELSNLIGSGAPPAPAKPAPEPEPIIAEPDPIPEPEPAAPITTPPQDSVTVDDPGPSTPQMTAEPDAPATTQEPASWSEKLATFLASADPENPLATLQALRYFEAPDDAAAAELAAAAAPIQARALRQARLEGTHASWAMLAESARDELTRREAAAVLDQFSALGITELTSRTRIQDGDNITERIKSAAANSLIIVEPGRYECEDLSLEKPVFLVADGGTGAVTLHFASSRGLQVEADLGYIAGLTLSDSEGRGVSRGLLEVNGGAMVIADCAATGRAGPALQISGKRTAPTLFACLLSGGDECVASFASGTKAVLDGCEITGGVRDGVRTSDGSDPTIRHTLIRNHARHGFYTTNAGRGMLINCVVADNGEHGVIARDAANLTLHACRIEGNANSGTHCSDGSSIVVTESRYSGNVDGIVIGDAGDLTLERSNLIGNRRNGLHVESSGIASVVTTLVADNAVNGILVSRSGRLNIEGGEIQGNDIGLRVERGARGRMQQVNIHDNRSQNEWIDEDGRFTSE